MGLAYSIYTNPSVYFDAGSFNICVNYTATNTGKILSAIKGELDSLLKDGISKEEFSRAIIQLKTNLIFSEESIQTQMLGFGKLLLLKDEVYSIEKKIEELKNATTNGVMAFARTVLSQKPSISYLGRSPDVDIQF
jgi:predicted Zn-dependent peptidase